MNRHFDVISERKRLRKLYDNKIRLEVENAFKERIFCYKNKNRLTNIILNIHCNFHINKIILNYFSKFEL